MLQKLAAKARAFIYFYLLCTSAVPLNDSGLSFDIQWACSGIKTDLKIELRIKLYVLYACVSTLVLQNHVLNTST